jgi:anti-sigma regulatory factor (Ser/Thr protein kinase)
VTASTTVGPAVTGTTFDHPALFYRDATGYLDATTGFVRSALVAGDAVLVAVPGPKLSLLRAALADVAARVSFADMAVAGRNPGRIIPGVLLRFAETHSGRRVSIIGEPIWPGRSALEYPACVAHEALINAVFSTRDAAILCPYDAAGLDETALADAWRTHPHLIDGSGRRTSDRYTDPLSMAHAVNVALPAAPAGAPALSYREVSDLSAVRRFVVQHTAALSDERRDDLVMAVNELAGNTVAHTAAGGRVSVWAEPGEQHLVCQITDTGHLADPLAGRIPAPRQSDGGHGLLLVNQLCDLVRIHTGTDGTTIRLHMWY